MDGYVKVGDKYNVGGSCSTARSRSAGSAISATTNTRSKRRCISIATFWDSGSPTRSTSRSSGCRRRYVRRRSDDGRLFHDPRHRPSFARDLPESGARTGWDAAAPAGTTPTPRSPPTRSPGRSEPCARSATASTGSSRSASIPAASAATCRARTGTPIHPIPKATPTRSITASSRSAGTCKPSRRACASAASTTSPTCRRFASTKNSRCSRPRAWTSNAGTRHVEKGPFKYDVGGVMLARPFKVIKIGPVRLFVHDMAKCLDFYTKIMGLRVTEEVDYQGHRCVFLRCNTEHHSLALYPIALRAKLGLSPHTTCMSFGNQVGDYQQLRERDRLPQGERRHHQVPAARALPRHRLFAPSRSIPTAIPIQLYYYMEQIGWDGKAARQVRAAARSTTTNWPDDGRARWPTATTARPCSARWGKLSPRACDRGAAPLPPRSRFSAASISRVLRDATVPVAPQDEEMLSTALRTSPHPEPVEGRRMSIQP